MTDIKVTNTNRSNPLVGDDDTNMETDKVGMGQKSAETVYLEEFFSKNFNQTTSWCTSTNLAERFEFYAHTPLLSYHPY